MDTKTKTKESPPAKKMKAGWICFPQNGGDAFLHISGVLIEQYSESVTRNSRLVMANGVQRIVVNKRPREIYEAFTEGV